MTKYTLVRPDTTRQVTVVLRFEHGASEEDVNASLTQAKKEVMIALATEQQAVAAAKAAQAKAEQETL